MSELRLDAPLDELLDMARQRFDVHFEPLTVEGCTLEFLQISDMNAFLDKLAETLAPGEGLDLPLWARIWPAALLMSYFVHRLPVRPGASVLEIGAGVGVCGLFAAARGFDAVISDIEPNALLFSQINALHNGLADKVSVRRIDFARDRLETRFDYVLGCEVLYMEEHFRSLLKFLQRSLKRTPEAEAVLAYNYMYKVKKFTLLADRDFRVQEKVIGCKTIEADAEPGRSVKPERHLCAITRMNARKCA